MRYDLIEDLKINDKIVVLNTNKSFVLASTQAMEDNLVEWGVKAYDSGASSSWCFNPKLTLKFYGLKKG